MTKFTYQIVLPTGEVLVADTMRSTSSVINAHFGFNVTTPDIIANLIYRPPKRRRVPGIVINRRRTSLCTSSGSQGSAPLYQSPFSSPPVFQHTCLTNSYDGALCSQPSSPVSPP
jgi:hypothetical protein